MGHATSTQKAERLNHARRVMAQAQTSAAAVAQLRRDCGISRRQAYRYVQEARALRAPVPVPDVKVPVTVKISARVVQALRAQARAMGLSFSELVGRALLAHLPRSVGRG